MSYIGKHSIIKRNIQCLTEYQAIILSDNTYYLTYLNLALTLHSRSCYFLYLTDKKTEEQWGKSQCPVSHKYWEAGI